jgi:hypothetical protein
LGDDSHAQFARARAIEFGEEDGLPAPKGKLAAFDPNSFGRAYERGLDVRIGITLGVLVGAGVRYEAVEGSLNVARDGRVIAFIDEYARSRMRNIEKADPLIAAGITQGLLDFGGDVLKLGSARRADTDRARERRALLHSHATMRAEGGPQAVFNL